MKKPVLLPAILIATLFVSNANAKTTMTVVKYEKAKRADVWAQAQQRQVPDSLNSKVVVDDPSKAYKAP